MEQLPFLEEQPAVYTVSDVNRLIAGMVKAAPFLRNCWVAGEVSKVSVSGSGHCYFNLKDNNAEMRAVVWKSSFNADIRALISQGNAIEAHGYMAVYEKGGYYQLVIDKVRPKGRGNIYEELEKLRRKLAAEGLFDQERKRPLPRIPRTIGLVTSASGAAVHDILNTLRGRWPLTEVWLSPAAVQGDTAPGEMIAALRLLYNLKPDVIILARGGGSAEDLWCFNDEALVRVVAESPVPLITGVGHEVDTTLVDYASDFRAPTPTGAAVRAVPSKEDVLYGLAQIRSQLEKAVSDSLNNRWQNLDILERRLKTQSPEEKIKSNSAALRQLETRLALAEKTWFERKKTALTGLEKRLQALSPDNVMKRGYAFIHREDHVVTSAADLNSGDRIGIRFKDGERSATVD